MVAYDPRRWPDPAMRLSQPTLDALSDAMAPLRAPGAEPSPKLEQAICAAAEEARQRGITPEMLLVQLKLVAEDVGIPPHIGDDHALALRAWIVSACVAAYFRKN